MGKTREIKKRIKAVGNIRRITNTMRMIATSKFARAQAAATATKPYTEGLFGLVNELGATAGGGDITHPLIAGPQGGAGAGGKAQPVELTLIITSDRGLCGPYNSSVLRKAMGHMRASPAAKTGRVEIVGKKGNAFMKYNGVAVAQVHAVGDKPTFEKVEPIAQSYIDRFIAGEVSAIRIVYMKFHSPGRQTAEVLQLLPFKPPAPPAPPTPPAGAAAAKPAAGTSGTNTLYEFSPPAEELLGDLLPATVKATVFQCFNDAVVSEHVARMVAMKAATDNAGKMRKLLTRDYNRARQAQITTELSEIISGAAALG
ncbi:MAG: ATP synthase F1 subunit gamma [Chloroflexi bacterium]|nr:ATP synthase F1 subunit gamma [Chloroflexota bacterium]